MALKWYTAVIDCQDLHAQARWWAGVLDWQLDGRDAEIASALSDLAAHGNAARLPRSIVVKH
jgi:hypothetical protein